MKKLNTMGWRRSISASVMTGFAVILGMVSYSAEFPGRQQDTERNSIELRLLPKRHTVNAGDSLEVTVEIWNVGTKEVFLGKSIDGQSPVSHLSLSLEGGSPNSTGSGVNGASDSLPNPSEPFANTLVKHWIPLPPGAFFGRVVSMDPHLFSQLLTPGRYLLKGAFRSVGFPTSPGGMNGLELNPDEAAKLPYPGWKGQADSKPIWIEVVSARKRN
jgi:hypothetical protein